MVEMQRDCVICRGGSLRRGGGAFHVDQGGCDEDGDEGEDRAEQEAGVGGMSVDLGDDLGGGVVVPRDGGGLAAGLCRAAAAKLPSSDAGS
jgi:hypothetical protein